MCNGILGTMASALCGITGLVTHVALTNFKRFICAS